MSGHVALVGAGPGDPGLLTVRGQQLLTAADVVVHDRLIGPEILSVCRAGAELIEVAKRPGGVSVAQEAINQLLIARARAGLEVVRLKGGDPFVFGRGGEEAMALAEAGIRFELVPGVSSAMAAPAAAGIPVTHRNTARSLTVITAHADSLDDHNWPALAAADTLVVLMGAATVAEIARRLIAAGRSAETPAAAVQQATLPDQRELRSTLAGLPAAVTAAQLGPPLVLVIGAVAAFDVRRLLADEAVA